MSYYRSLIQSGSAYPSSLKLFIDAGNPSSYSGSGTTVTDLIGTQNGTLVNAVGYNSANGGYFTLNGVDQYLDFTTNSAIQPIPSRTVSFWTYINTDVGILYSSGNVNANRDCVAIWQDTVNTYLRFANGSTFEEFTDDLLPEDTWVFVVLRFNGSSAEVYFNDVLKLSVTQTITPTYNASFSTRLGTYNGSGYYLDGRFSILKIYDEYRTIGQNTTDFNEFKSRYGYNPAYGALTNAWVVATGENNATILNKWNAVETGVTSFLSKIDCLYGFNTTDATKSKFNFLNAVDSDAAFRITWSGSLTFTNDGVQGTGATNGGNTHWMPSVNGTVNSMHISGYAMQDLIETSAFMGSQGDNPNYNYVLLYPRYTGNLLYGVLQSSITLPNFTNSNSIGFYVINLKSTGDLQIWKDGVKLSTTAIVNTGLNNANIHLLTSGSTSGIGASSSNRIKFATIGRELSDSDVVALSTTALNFVS